jgi:hypothetical protein
MNKIFIFCSTCKWKNSACSYQFILERESSAFFVTFEMLLRVPIVLASRCIRDEMYSIYNIRSWAWDTTLFYFAWNYGTKIVVSSVAVSILMDKLQYIERIKGETTDY